MFKRILIGLSAGFLVFALMFVVTNSSEAKSENAALSLNWGSELNADKCVGKLGNEPVLNITHKVVNDIDSGFHGYWAYDSYNRHIQVWPTSESSWQIEGEHRIVFTLGSGNYPHTMNVTTFNSSTGDFSGTGTYDPDNSYTWDLTGNISGSNVTFHIVYKGTNSGYTVDGVGTIADDGSASGTATSSSSQEFTWVMDAESFTMSDVDYCALVQYEGKFDAEEAEDKSPGEGVEGGKDLTGDENGTMLGGYIATFTGKFMPNDQITEGSLGVKDYKCTLENPGTCEYWSWPTTYFSGYSNWQLSWWGWIYKSSRFGTWVNASTGSFGDISAQ